MMARHDTKAPAPKKVKLTTSSMIASIAAEGQATKPAPFGHALVELARSRPEIIGMTADLGKYTDLHIFKEAFPDRYYQMGMAEQLLFGAAAGLAHEGFMPFATTYAVFASRRAYDFIHQTIAEENLDVKIAAALPGLTSGYGPSHQAAEDLALFRAMPNMTVIDPCDALEIEQVVPAMAAHKGPVYMRLLRGKVPLVLDEYGYHFELGKAQGRSATGRTCWSSPRACSPCGRSRWRRRSRPTRSRSPCCTCRRSSRSIRRRSSREAGRTGRMVVVAENHTVIGGLGEAVAGVLLRDGVAPKFRHIGLPDEFLLAGALPTLHDRYGISAERMSDQHQGLALTTRGG